MGKIVKAPWTAAGKVRGKIRQLTGGKYRKFYNLFWKKSRLFFNSRRKINFVKRRGNKCQFSSLDRHFISPKWRFCSYPYVRWDVQLLYMQLFQLKTKYLAVILKRSNQHSKAASPISPWEAITCCLLAVKKDEIIQTR